MAEIDLGRISLVFKGTYAGGTTYEKNDIVAFTDSGELSSYIYVNATAAAGQTPSTGGTVNTTYWSKMAKGTSLGVGNNKLVITDGSGNVSSVAIGSANQVFRTNASANGFEFATADSGKTLQTVKARTNSVISSSNNYGGKSYPSNMGSGNGAQILSVSITPQYAGSSFFLCHYSGDHAAGGNDHSAIAAFHGSTRVTTACQTNYASDAGSYALNFWIDTSGLSGAQTIQVRNMGTNGGNNHYVNADHGGNNKSTYAFLTVQEIKN